MWKGWVNSTTFTALPINLTTRGEATRTPQVTPSMGQPEIMIGGMQQKNKVKQEENVSQEEEEVTRQAMIASLETTRGG